MRTSLVLALALTTALSTACGGALEADDATGSQSSALLDPRVPLEPQPNPKPCCTFIPTTRTPGEIIPPAPPPPASLHGTITSYAGFGGHYGHDNGPVQTSFTGPSFVASTPSGFTWVVDIDGDPTNSCIRLIQNTRPSGAAAGGKHVQTFLQQNGYGFDVNAISGVTVDPTNGDLFMTADNGVYRLAANGDFNQFSGYHGYGAGASTPPPAGYADSFRFNTRFNGPAGIVRDAQGNLFVADTNNHAIRKLTWSVDPSGLPLATVTTVARDTSAAAFSPTSLAIDERDGSLYAVSGQAVYHVILGAPVANPQAAVGTVNLHAGSPTTWGFADTSATGGFGYASGLFNTPKGIAVDRSGNVYVADLGNKLIRKITSNGTKTSPVTVETVAFHALLPAQVTFDGYGPDDDAALMAPFGLSFWNDALVMTDGVRGNVRILH